MKEELLERFIRVRVTNGDREFIEQHILQTGISISDLFRDLIKELKRSTRIMKKEQGWDTFLNLKFCLEFGENQGSPIGGMEPWPSGEGILVGRGGRKIDG